jgi:hypothetical protein
MENHMNWTDEEINILIDNYGTIKKIDLLTLLPNRTIKSIGWKAQDLKLVANRNITNKKTVFNFSFFNNVNPLSCYIAGLIAADGCIDTKRGNVWFSQKKKELVEYIKTSLYANNNIWYRKRKNTEEYSIAFKSHKLVEDIKNNFGIIDNKSKIGLPIPPSIKELNDIYCYIAGLIDGDGSISYKKRTPKSKPKISFTLLCSKDILNWINCQTNSNISIHKRHDCKIDLFKMYSSHNKALNFLIPIYDCLVQNDIFISEKWEKVNEAKLK